jgi:asparagine synthase (glutamine-hydrolysing)
MCGICGVISEDRGEIETSVRRMMQAMVHRGPDDEGFELLNVGGYEFGPCAGFGFRRLAIVDLTSAGHQPMFNPNTGDCLIFNGEIYNFRRLRAELQCEGVSFRGHSDTEVLLHALSRWGETALAKVQGMFAVAFYEAKTGRILLARDPLGIKPLYIAELPNRVVFASEIRALLASQIVPRNLDVAGVAGMLAYGAMQSPRTIYESIKSFPAGSSLWLDATAISGNRTSDTKRFWSFPPTTQAGMDEPTAAANVRLLLRDAVLRHLVADVPVGVFLSAGIDSTIIASLAKEYTPSVTAFTVGFGNVHGEDETALAAQTAKALDMKHVAVELDARNMPEKWHDWILGLDSPSIDGFNTYIVSRRLAEEGVVVGLSGLGADELFGGYNTFSRAPRWSRLLRALELIPPGLRSSAIRQLGKFDGRTGAFDKLADLAAGDTSVAGVALSLRRSLSNRSLKALGISAYVAGLRVDHLRDSSREVERPADDFNTVTRMEMTHYMGDTLLRDTDTTSMRHSLEVRVPFLDLPLVDYVSALPGRLKQGRNVNGKSLLRLACREVIPNRIAARRKTGFSLPIGRWMRKEMRDSCEAAIARLENVPFLESREVRRIWDTYLADKNALHWSRPLALVVLGTSIG